MKEQEVNPVEVIKAMSKFMTQTNEMIAKLELKTDNFQIDINKLKKELQNYKDNGKRIINV